ncbi:MAG: hypothetical protein ACR5LC_13820 [Symbiopectobacterium sp.]
MQNLTIAQTLTMSSLEIAELIEAAPDLLEALEGALGWLNNGLAS